MGTAATPHKQAIKAYRYFNKQGLADYSLLTCSAVTCIFCFVELETIIEGMLTTRLLVHAVTDDSNAQ